MIQHLTSLACKLRKEELIQYHDLEGCLVSIKGELRYPSSSPLRLNLARNVADT